MLRSPVLLRASSALLLPAVLSTVTRRRILVRHDSHFLALKISLTTEK